MLYILTVIKTIRSKALRRLAERNDASNLPSQFVPKIKRILTQLNEASEPEDMNLPGYDNHPLKQSFAGFWSVTVTRNWRIVYRMEAGDAYDVDYLDYH